MYLSACSCRVLLSQIATVDMSICYEDLSTAAAKSLVANVTTSVKNLMSQPPFDCSHDFFHVSCVSTTAKRLAASERTEKPPIDNLLVTLAALLHDVGDHKYALAGPEANSAESILLRHSAPPTLTSAVQTLFSHVSCSYETDYPETVAAMRTKHSELASVQDADRFDAIGAIGVGRGFAFGGATNRTLNDTEGEFEGRLL